MAAVVAAVRHHNGEENGAGDEVVTTEFGQEHAADIHIPDSVSQ
jgi:hypothetical protein